jgi:hypothetical protein
LDIISRLGFFFYWIFDNLNVLIKIKFFSFAELKDVVRIATKCWLFGILSGLVIAIRNLVRLNKKASIAYAECKKAGDDDVAKDKLKATMTTIKASQLTNKINVIKNCGDCITASQGLGYPEMLFGFNFSDGWIGCGGFTSAFLTCWTLYK